MQRAKAVYLNSFAKREKSKLLILLLLICKTVNLLLTSVQNSCFFSDMCYNSLTKKQERS